MESAGARNIRVSVEGAADPVQPKNNKGQTLLPWRMKTSAGLQLRTLLIRHVLSENLHLKEGKSGVGKMWDQLVDQLMKEPEFCQHFTLSTAPLSGRNLRDHYERIVNEQCEFHGWDRHGGVTGNLSGGEGDLDELGRNVRQILMDIEEKEAKKEAEKAAKEDLENKESAILDGEIQRKAKAASGPDMQLAVSAKRKPPLVPTPTFLGAVLAPTAPTHLQTTNRHGLQLTSLFLVVIPK